MASQKEDKSSKDLQPKNKTTHSKTKYGFSRLSPVFPVYLFSSLLDYPKEVTDEFYKNYKELDMYNNGAHLISTTDFKDCVITKLKLENLKNLIIHKTKIYCKELNYHPKSVILNSWISITRPGEYVNTHNHINADISGVFYIKTNGKDGKLYLKNPTPQLYYSPLFKRAAKVIQVEPVVGKIVLWPSFLDHGVEKNTSDEERISIAFNLHFSDEEIKNNVESE